MAALCTFHWGFSFHIQGSTLLKVHITRKKLQIKVVWNWISYKKVPKSICLSPHRVELGARKTDMVEIWYSTEMEKYIQFGAQSCQKYTSHEKKFQIKVVRNWILYKKVLEHICLSLPHPRVELEWLIWLKYDIVLKGENTFNLELKAAKKRITQKSFK